MNTDLAGDDPKHLEHQWTYDEWEENGVHFSSDHWCIVCHQEWDPRLSEDELPPCKRQ